MKKFKTANAPSIIFRLKDIEDRNKIVLFNIADLLNKKVNINIELLAYVCGCSPRTINRRLNELEESGYISRETKYIDKKRQSTISIQWNKIQDISVKSDFFNTEEVEEDELVEIKPNEEVSQTIEQYINLNQDTNMGNYIGTLEQQENNSMDFNTVLKTYNFNIKSIINDFNSGYSIRNKQAKENLKILLNRKDTMPYKDKIISIINNNVYHSQLN